MFCSVAYLIQKNIFVCHSNNSFFPHGVAKSIQKQPKTRFLTDIQIHDGTGKGLFLCIKEHLESRGVDIGKVTGLGTDGADVMTGRGEGLTGHFLRINAHLVNCHCSAQRVALVS